MKGLQALLKVKQRKVRRDKRRQGDAEDELVCSKHQEGSAQHKRMVMDLDQIGGVLSSVDSKKERSRQRSPSKAKRGESQVSRRQEPQASRECFHGVSYRDRDRVSNDLVNHIGCVFRYFIANVVDPGSTPNVAHCGRELEHRLIDSWSPRLEEERHMKKFPSETEETRKVKEIFGLQEKKKNCWTFFAAAAQVYGEMIHESVESVEMISSYEIRVR
ncbi:hypothetical protein F2Q69_00024680 [Brassica cretica]|uniref:Uncharacterized protein n=1 Tax=Brassica cretica TaxID=69181 RepID=A0A8S9QIF0_BRACR|nr:hypothetical protein F2Q69_00024680 [Brassica cretica]